MNPFKIMKNMMLYPDEFFSNIQSEQKKALTAFLYIGGISLAISWTLLYLKLIPAHFSGFQYIFDHQQAEIYVPVIYFAISILFTLLYSTLVLMYAKIKKLNHTYGGTLTSIAYGSLPATLFSFLPILNILFGLWTWFLQIKGLSVLNSVSEKQAFFSTIPAVLTLALLTILQTMMFTTLFG